jgi:hypothetical protein
MRLEGAGVVPKPLIGCGCSCLLTATMIVLMVAAVIAGVLT